jgi:hypothetical protein
MMLVLLCYLLCSQNQPHWRKSCSHTALYMLSVKKKKRCTCSFIVWAISVHDKIEHGGRYGENHEKAGAHYHGDSFASLFGQSYVHC